ncbi:uncharacterized protein K452DRAFT_356512 [Aplosporella prunicola CBS 121167]|uniref:Uncharacterized protein n=1 Tax=Aplosporella prunicola CBS 121167 TaxID=1176127 RepID=A0A6A6BRL2_9PEZI|nr:uncharacterized protein K452DRAFT_356512 [Aplosporella prunicola CBS 121167]KAF2145221.1 hypothetical protein K452DRAFT_356512 [Aplosporella prunicola CBS 121167]
MAGSKDAKRQDRIRRRVFHFMARVVDKYSKKDKNDENNRSDRNNENDTKDEKGEIDTNDTNDTNDKNENNEDEENENDKNGKTETHAPQAPPPLGFLSLPAELRISVYEFIFKEVTFWLFLDRSPGDRVNIRFRKNRSGVPLAMLQTCKTIASELRGEMYRKARVQVVNSMPPEQLAKLHQEHYYPRVDEHAVKCMCAPVRTFFASVDVAAQSAEWTHLFYKQAMPLLRVMSLMPCLRQSALCLMFHRGEADPLDARPMINHLSKVASLMFSRMVERVPHGVLKDYFINKEIVEPDRLEYCLHMFWKEPEGDSLPAANEDSAESEPLGLYAPTLSRDEYDHEEPKNLVKEMKLTQPRPPRALLDLCDGWHGPPRRKDTDERLGTPANTPADTPAVTPAATHAVTPANIPVDIPVDTPANTPSDTSTGILADTLARTHAAKPATDTPARDTPAKRKHPFRRRIWPSRPIS